METAYWLMEDEIDRVDACEKESDGRLVVYLVWKNGRKTRHETSVIYQKCPQKFYEKHVKVIKDEH
ncbi:Chromatin-associated protein swi6 [Metarhizium anisopliae]